MSDLQKCFNGDPFCWNQEPKVIYCYKVKKTEVFPYGDSLYKYNLETKKWDLECGGDSICCEDGCLVRAVQMNDPEHINRVYYNFQDIKSHLDHIDSMSDLTSENALIQEFEDVKEERDRAEEESMSCQNRMNEIEEELKGRGCTEVMNHASY